MNILLTSAGRRSYIVDYFKSCEGIGKVYASNSEYSVALKRSDGYFISPLIYSDEYIPSIIEFCKKHDVKAVLSLFDIDLLVLASNEVRFRENGIELIIAPADFVRKCNDKWRTYEFLKSLDIPTPKTFKSLADAQQALAAGEVTYPIIVKPRWGMSSTGLYKAENDLELQVFAEKCRRDIFNSYLKFESSMTPDEVIIFQEVVCGEEYGLEVLNDLSGSYVDCFAIYKLAMRSGETDCGRSVDSNPFEDTAKKISLHSGHHGLLSIDCFKTPAGVSVIDMNCRISGHYPISYLVGFNYPQIVTDWMNGLPLNADNLKVKTDVCVVKDLVPTILE